MRPLVRTAQDVFHIPARGCIVAPGPAAVARLGGETGRAVLRRPGGSEVETAFRVTRPGPGAGVGVDDVEPAILLPDVEKEDVPAGTEIWLV